MTPLLQSPARRPGRSAGPRGAALGLRRDAPRHRPAGRGEGARGRRAESACPGWCDEVGRRCRCDGVTERTVDFRLPDPVGRLRAEEEKE